MSAGLIPRILSVLPDTPLDYSHAQHNGMIEGIVAEGAIGIN